MSKLIEYLKDRNLIFQLTDEDQLKNIFLKKKYVTVYCGFDITAESLHIGHLALLICLKHFLNFGHKVIILVGGATTLIGDPSFRSKKREFISAEIIQKRLQKICKQISLFFNIKENYKNILIKNNYDWFSKINLIKFLREIGCFFSVRKLMNKKFLKQRINNKVESILFSELSYNLLQSYDFARLNYENNVILQIGGSDQWGNIVSGIELVRRLYKKKVFGLTVPLILNSSGIKFSKSEKEVIWLDSSKTSPYEFYQFWINVSDLDVYKYLKMFTFISTEKILIIKDKINNLDNFFYAKCILAKEVTRIVHGYDISKIVEYTSNCLFKKKISDYTFSDFLKFQKCGFPSFKFKFTSNIKYILVCCKFATSKSQAKLLIFSRSIKINGNLCIDENFVFQKDDLLFNKFSLIKKGKKKYCLIIWEF